MTDTHIGARSPRLRLAVALCVLAAAVAAAWLAGSPAGASKAKILGHTKHTPKPDCPKSCFVITRVTGFQTRADGKKLPFKIPADGHIVAWATDLSKPKKPQRKFFGALAKDDKWGQDPTARISIVKRVKKHDYKLKKQSPTQVLKSSMGDKAYFTLNDPLRVQKGDVLALTTPTWSPNFNHGVSREKNKWRASRSRKNCSPKNQTLNAVKDFVRKSKPHQKVGSPRSYGCNYNGERLLYWGYFVPS